MATDKEAQARDTALRYIAMLSHIPLAPRHISVTELQSKLDEEGYAVDVRTIQRDLSRLSTHFRLDSTQGRGRELRWFFNKGTANQWPAMNTDTALTLLMAEQNLRPLIPKQATDSLTALVNQARNTQSARQKWTQKNLGRFCAPRAARFCIATCRHCTRSDE